MAAEYAFQTVLVYGSAPGGVVRLLRNGKVDVYNAATDAFLFTLTSDNQGLVTFTTTDVPTIYLKTTGWTSPHITAASAIEASAAFTVSEDNAVAALATPGSGSATEAVLNSTFGTKAQQDANTTNIAGKVGKGTLAYYAGDYANPQACLDAAPAGSIVKLDTATITTALSITKAVNIVGGGNRNTVITANGCDGFVIANGVGDVTIQRLTVKQSVRHTTTANTFVGIKILGDATHRPSVHTYRDLYLDGFETGIQANYLWTSRFDNVQTAFGLYGIDVYGLSENNTVTGCNLVVGIGSQTRLSGSACIQLNGQISRTDATPLVSEGWVITGSLLYGGDYGINALGYGNYQVANCILDAMQICGVRIVNNGTAYGGNALIIGNYIAFAGNAATALAGVEIANTVVGVRPSRVVNNDILVYTGGSANYGVHTIASAGAAAIVKGNVINGMHAADIRFESSGNSAIGNTCLTPVASLTLTKNIYSDSGQHNLVSDNVGAVYVAGGTLPNTYTMVGGVKVAPAVAAPTSTAVAWDKGSRVPNYNATVGQPKAWVCTVAGSPGTWVSEGNL